MSAFGSPFRLNRRTALAGGAASLLWGCGRGAPEFDLAWSGGFVGEAVVAGHRWRDQAEAAHSSPRRSHRCDVLIVGAGVAGLSAARVLREAGVDDVVLLELHDQAGGNSRGHQVGGLACPLGAHYLPVPDAADLELMRWLHEIGLARQALGRTVFDERHLCHSPQERVWHDGQWHEGLLPPLEPGTPGFAQGQRLSQRIASVSAELRFAMPSTRLRWLAGHDELDGQTFARWLDVLGITDPLLRWYLDYCCLDDYGAPASVVSAWAGLHYFASRHGFRMPGKDSDAPADAVLTWPEGNQWLVRRLAQPLGERVKTGWLASGLIERRDRVSVWAQKVVAGDEAVQEWDAKQVILALPLSWARRLLGTPPAGLTRASDLTKSSAWLVANVHLEGPLVERPGVTPAWDNVVAGRAGLGYVDARHQTLGARDPALLLTAYHALPQEQRGNLLNRSWRDWSRWVVEDLAAVHADLPGLVRQVDITRHGHAMGVPLPGVRGSAELAALRAGPVAPRIHLAHTDLVGYSVFEEAFALGLEAGRRVAQALGARPPRSS